MIQEAGCKGKSMQSRHLAGNWGEITKKKQGGMTSQSCRPAAIKLLLDGVARIQFAAFLRYQALLNQFHEGLRLNHLYIAAKGKHPNDHFCFVTFPIPDAKAIPAPADLFGLLLKVGKMQHHTLQRIAFIRDFHAYFANLFFFRCFPPWPTAMIIKAGFYTR